MLAFKKYVLLKPCRITANPDFVVNDSSRVWSEWLFKGWS